MKGEIRPWQGALVEGTSVLIIVAILMLPLANYIAAEPRFAREIYVLFLKLEALMSPLVYLIYWSEWLRRSRRDK